MKDFLGSAHVFATAVRDVMESRLLRQISGRQVTQVQLKLLTLVQQTDTPSVGDAAAFLGVTKAAASQTVDKLVRRKWLRREEDQADRRSAKLSLTEAGRQLLETYESVRAEKLGRVFREYSPENLRRMSDMLDRVSAEIVNHTAKPEEVCLQCGIYFRERCLLRSLIGRTCFYQRHRGEKRGSARS
jgi:DNA-binding MarR family transcriptional regulator